METSESGTTSGPTIKSTLPSDLYVLKLIESHSLEMNSLSAECTTKLPKLMSQRLPRFMRRRAASHNPKRIPKSIRNAFVNQITESVLKPKNSKKKKKYVNKEKSEMSLKRRQQKNDRTVLHVWFAKRFRMKMHWNYLIPEKNSTKNERLLYHNSKNDVVFYYLSHYSCLEMDFSESNRQQLISYLSKFVNSEIGCTFGAKIYSSDKREGNIVLYDNSYPSKLLVSSYFLWNNTSSKLWLWIHISVYETVFELLKESSKTDYSNQFEIKRKTKQLERFRLIGPKALQLLNKCFKCESNELCQLIEAGDNSVHYLRYTDNRISLIESNQTTLFKDSDQRVSSQKSSNNFDFIVVLRNKTYKNRFTTDLIVSNDSAKTLWQKLVENRGHKTGGLHDLRMIAFNTSSLLFPTFGFIDAKENVEKVEKLKHLLEIDSEKDVYVIRNESIILNLCRNISSLSVSQMLQSIQSIALINVEMVCVDRGVPQPFDYICIPTEGDIRRVINKTDDKNREESQTNRNSDEIKRKIIGLIEFGKYSLEKSRGKGLGVITITSFRELIEIKEKIKYKNYNNQTLASIKCLKSGLYRMVCLKPIDSVTST